MTWSPDNNAISEAYTTTYEGVHCRVFKTGRWWSIVIGEEAYVFKNPRYKVWGASLQGAAEATIKATVDGPGGSASVGAGHL